MSSNITYLYSFDFICRADSVFSTKLNIKSFPGDLLFDGNRYYLNLGANISFQNLINDFIELENEIKIEYKGLLGKITMDLIHAIVLQNYTLYRLVIPMFLGNDLSLIIKRSTKKIRKGEISHIDYLKYINEGKLDIVVGQQLIVLPDIWSIMNKIDAKYLDLDGINVLDSKATNLQKSKVFWNIKIGLTNTLICTYSQIFQDWNDLKSIIIFSPHQWYYKNQKDPRFSTIDILKLFSDFYGSKINYINDYRLFDNYLLN